MGHNNGNYFFMFENASMRDEVIDNGPWHFVGNPIIIQKWTPNFSFAKDSTSKIPVWVKFHNIPMQLWTEEGLSYVASSVGIPLYADTITEGMQRISFARICVELKVMEDYPKVIEVRMEDGSYAEVGVEYQEKPSSCVKCGIFGHGMVNCPKAKKAWVAINNRVEVFPYKSKIEVQKALEEGWTQVQHKGIKTPTGTDNAISGVLEKGALIEEGKAAKEGRRNIDLTKVTTHNQFDILEAAIEDEPIVQLKGHHAGNSENLSPVELDNCGGTIQGKPGVEGSNTDSTMTSNPSEGLEIDKDELTMVTTPVPSGLVLKIKAVDEFDKGDRVDGKGVFRSNKNDKRRSGNKSNKFR